MDTVSVSPDPLVNDLAVSWPLIKIGDCWKFDGVSIKEIVSVYTVGSLVCLTWGGQVTGWVTVLSACRVVGATPSPTSSHMANNSQVGLYYMAMFSWPVRYAKD